MVLLFFMDGVKYDMMKQYMPFLSSINSKPLMSDFGYQNTPGRSPFSGYGLGLRKDRYHIDGHQRPHVGDLRGQQGPHHCAAACGP